MKVSVEQYEKYYLARNWAAGYDTRDAVNQFAAWFAESDWDDPVAAWVDYHSLKGQ